MNQPTVRTFIAVLTSKLTQYDAAQCKREAKHGRSNIYRLGLLFEAVSKVETACADCLDSSDSRALNRLKQAMYSHFAVPFSPVSWTEKQIDRWQLQGLAPRII